MELQIGRVYKLRSRNLRLGVFTGKFFIGIRTKFGNRFLDVEFPYTQTSGTAIAEQEIGTIEENIPLVESLGSHCGNCGKPAKWTGPPAPAPWVCDGGCEKVMPCSVSNEALFQEMQKYER